MWLRGSMDGFLLYAGACSVSCDRLASSGHFSPFWNLVNRRSVCPLHEGTLLFLLHELHFYKQSFHVRKKQGTKCKQRAALAMKSL